MKVEKTVEVLGEEWRLSFQSFTHSPDVNLRCRFYMTRHHDFKSLELRMVYTSIYCQLFLYTQKPLVLYPKSIREAKVEILKFLTGYVNN
jgi:hypothetical protein